MLRFSSAWKKWHPTLYFVQRSTLITSFKTFVSIRCQDVHCAIGNLLKWWSLEKNQEMFGMYEFRQYVVGMQLKTWSFHLDSKRKKPPSNVHHALSRALGLSGEACKFHGAVCVPSLMAQPFLNHLSPGVQVDLWGSLSWPSSFSPSFTGYFWGIDALSYLLIERRNYEVLHGRSLWRKVVKKKKKLVQCKWNHNKELLFFLKGQEEVHIIWLKDKYW